MIPAPFLPSRAGQTFLIAEAGVNHNGDLDMARRLVDEAHACGADAVKFQTFVPEELNSRRAPKAQYHIETTGNEESWLDLLRSQVLTAEMHHTLVEHCAARGLLFLSTPYDHPSADLLASLRLPLLKVASTDFNNLPFLRYLARFKVPLLLGTGMATADEVDETVTALRAAGATEIVLLQCTSNYPAPASEANLRVLSTWQERYGLPVGFSDHTAHPYAPALAVALGAAVYETHFTLDRSLPGPDHRSSREPEELRRIFALIRETEDLLGDGIKGVTPAEADNRRWLRKSLVARRDLPAGTVLSAADIAIKRPGTGLPPAALPEVLGRKLTQAIAADALLPAELLP